MTSLAGDTISHKNFLAKNFHIASPGGIAVSRESLVLQQRFFWMKVRTKCQAQQPLLLQEQPLASLFMGDVMLDKIFWDFFILFYFESIRNIL